MTQPLPSAGQADEEHRRTACGFRPLGFNRGSKQREASRLAENRFAARIEKDFRVRFERGVRVRHMKNGNFALAAFYRAFYGFAWYGAGLDYCRL